MSSVATLIQSMASALGVPPGLAVQVATQESSLNPNAVGSKGEQGLFQLMPATSAQLGVSDPFDPVQNTQGGLTYLQQLYQQFGDWATALAAYNWGPANVAKYGAAAAPASTQAYVANALAAAGPMGAASPSGSFQAAASPAATPYDPSQDTGEIIDLPGLVPSAAAATPNILLLALVAVSAYLALDILRGDA